MPQFLVVLFDRQEGRVEYFLIPDIGATKDLLSILTNVVWIDLPLEPDSLREELEPFYAGGGQEHDMLFDIDISGIVSLVI